jgi:hypothetical protein
MALTLRGNTVPMWFPYTALCYLVVSVSLFIFGKKRIVASSPTPDMAKQKKQNLSRGEDNTAPWYIWLIGPLFYVLDGGLKTNPARVLGFLPPSKEDGVESTPRFPSLISV